MWREVAESTKELPVISDEELRQAWENGTMWDLLPTQDIEPSMTDESDSDSDVETEDQEKVLSKIVAKWRMRQAVSMTKMRLLRRVTTKQKRNIVSRHLDIGTVMDYAGLCRKV